MIKDFLIISCTGKNDKIGLKINNKFFIHNFEAKIKNNEILASTILNLTKKHKTNIDENLSVLVNIGPGMFSSLRAALSVVARTANKSVSAANTSLAPRAKEAKPKTPLPQPKSTTR